MRERAQGSGHGDVRVSRKTRPVNRRGKGGLPDHGLIDLGRGPALSLGPLEAVTVGRLGLTYSGMTVSGVEPDTRLGARGRAVRLLAAATVLALLFVGTVWGQDSAFPVGPFRMYATRSGPDTVVKSTRVDGVNVAGHRIRIDDSETGLRRAEIEGQIDRFVADPSLLALIAASYARRNPDRLPLVRVEVVVRRFELRGGAQTGAYTDTVTAFWDADLATEPGL